MSIVTKTGDDGTTGIHGGGRASKDDPRIEACGTIDELNALLGVVLAEEPPSDLSTKLFSIQKTLFCLGADLATPLSSGARVARMDKGSIDEIEQWIVELESALSPLSCFILPGGDRAGSLLHLARTVARRAERRVVTLEHREKISVSARIYLNRLSDYLFVAARAVNRNAGEEERPAK